MESLVLQYSCNLRTTNICINFILYVALNIRSFDLQLFVSSNSETLLGSHLSVKAILLKWPLVKSSDTISFFKFSLIRPAAAFCRAKIKGYMLFHKSPLKSSNYIYIVSAISVYSYEACNYIFCSVDTVTSMLASCLFSMYIINIIVQIV